MGDICKEMIAVAFALPEVCAVFGHFVWPVSVKIFQKSQHNDLSNFELKIFAGEEDLVLRYEGQYPLVIIGQLFVDANPIQCR